MMRIDVLYFAAVRDLVGYPQEDLELPENVRNVGELTRHLEHIHEELAGRLAAVRIAVNEEFRAQDYELAEGDVVALIPPVAGG
jgi:molybdopterin synthase sulfur carrier subunit